MTQVFLISGTSWTVPADFNSTTNTIEAIGAGGNGGSIVCTLVPASLFNSTETVTVGAKGTGGASTTINTTAGSITEVASGGGYTTGGVAITKATSAQTSGTYTLAMTQPTNPLWTASTGFTFQYVVLVGSVSGPIGAWDYGSSQAVAAGETVSVTITTKIGRAHV